MAAIQNFITAENSQNAYPPPQQLPVMQAKGMSENQATYAQAGQAPAGTINQFASNPMYHGLWLVFILAILALFGSWIFGLERKHERREGD